MFEIYGKTTQNGTPTPENPIPIVNITGNINEKIQNKNFAPFTNQDFTVQGVEFKVINGTLYLNGTSTGEILTNNAEFKNNFSFILKAGTYKFSRQNPNSTAITISIKRYSDNENIISLVNAQNNSVDLTLAEDTKVYLGFYIYQKTFTNEEFAIQIEQGSTLTNDNPHAEQNISFPLEEGQVLAEGDYLADDGIHHVKGQVEINGTNETWERATTNKFLLRSNEKKGLLFKDIVTDNSKISVICNKLKGVSWNTMNSNSSGWEIALRQDGAFSYLRILTTGIDTISDLTTFLRTNPFLVDYPLAEEVIEPFTEEQQIEYTKIKELYTFNEITNIDGNANLKIKYWEKVER
jgi:hypothetical protein